MCCGNGFLTLVWQIITINEIGSIFLSLSVPYFLYRNYDKILSVCEVNDSFPQVCRQVIKLKRMFTSLLLTDAPHLSTPLKNSPVSRVAFCFWFKKVHQQVQIKLLSLLLFDITINIIYLILDQRETERQRVKQFLVETDQLSISPEIHLISVFRHINLRKLNLK